MTVSLRHRGPDGDGFFDAANAALGHRRLAIIDVAGGRQPISNEDGSVWVVFNGEIYNHSELREGLVGRGHRFRTNSDTEVIVHAFEEFGPACVERLNGMFAFAVYDDRSRQLFIARDRLGKKPLFFAVFDGVLHFASELAALRWSPVWDDTQSDRWVEEYLALGYIAAPRTVYKHVHKLEPAHWLLATADGIQIHRYWDVPEFDTDTRPEAAILTDLDALLQDSVTCRLESEVPLGAFLSGGIDSGLITAYMAEASGTPVQTISVGFDDSRHNELAAAALTATALRTTHHPEILRPDVSHVIDRVVEAIGEPFADSSVVPTFFVSEAARRHVTVALSGDGGDEAFAGYSFRYAPHAVESFLRSAIPPSIRPLIGAAGERWPRWNGLPRPLRLGTVLENLARDPADAYFADLCFLKPRDCQALLGRDPSFDYRDSDAYATATSAYLACRSTSSVQRAGYADMRVYLANGPLVKVDRMSMLNGLEVRCPLLDYRVVEFAFRLPVSRKMPFLRAKRLLRQLAARRIPAPTIATLPKRGFTAPAGDWVATSCGEQFASDVLANSSPLASLIDIRVAKRYLNEHVAGRADQSYALWALWIAGRWLSTPKTANTVF